LAEASYSEVSTIDPLNCCHWRGMCRDVIHHVIDCAKHASKHDCWILLHGQVYDVTMFLPLHPGGKDVILAVAGKDASEEFDAIHPPRVLEELERNPAISMKGLAAPCDRTSSSVSHKAKGFSHLSLSSMLPKLLCAFRVTNRAVVHLLAVMAAISVLYDPRELTFATVGVSFVLAFVNVGSCMSICLHRYFAHAAFETSRAFQVVIAIVSCFAGQGGCLWWASKHGRHHVHCDLPHDPHSRKQTSLWYAWFGWYYNPDEAHIDSAYVRTFSKFPELVLINELWFVPPLLAVIMSYWAIGFHYTVAFGTTPMFMSWVVTTWFNVEYHPAHSPGVSDEKVCRAADTVRILSEFVGESYHEDHHVYPQKSRRPGPDPPYHLIILPLLKLGLVWENQAKEHSS